MQCRICKSDDLRYYYSQGDKNQYKFYKCRNCGLVNYDLEGGLDQEKYGGTYISPYLEDHKQNVTQGATFNFIQENIQETGKVLDIGCGNGKLLLLLREAGWEVNGMELLPEYAKKIESEHNIEMVVGDFLEYKTDDKKYDLVILRHVLEHLPDSVLAMNKLNALLKQNGHLVMEFPNIESVEFKFKRFLSRLGLHKKKYKPDYKPGHCNEFSRSSFKYLVDHTGFELLSWELYSNKSGSSKLLTKLNIGSKARVLVKKK